jgi:quinol monooxygenase YgiN
LFDQFQEILVATERIRLLVDLDIREGKLAEAEAIAQQMVAVSEKEPGTLGYHFLLSADRTRCRLVEGYADAEAITAHFNGPAVRELVPQLVQFASPTRMEIYGEPGPQVAALAAAFGAEIFTSWHGFDR